MRPNSAGSRTPEPLKPPLYTFFAVKSRLVTYTNETKKDKNQKNDLQPWFC